MIETPLELLLVDPGPHRVSVILRVRDLKGISTTDAAALVEAGNVVIHFGRPCDRESCAKESEFKRLGATVAWRDPMEVFSN